MRGGGGERTRKGALGADHSVSPDSSQDVGLALHEGAITPHGGVQAPGHRAPLGPEGGESGEEEEDGEEDSAAPEWLLSSAETAVRRAESAFLHEDVEGAEAAAEELVHAATHRDGTQTRGASALSAPSVPSGGGDEEETLDSLEQLEQQLARRVSRVRQAHSPERQASATEEAGEPNAGGEGGSIPTEALHRYMAPELAEFVRNLRREVDEVMMPAEDILERRARALKRLTRSMRLVANAARATSPRKAEQARKASEGPDRIARRMCFAWMRMLRKRHAGEGRDTPFGRGCGRHRCRPAHRRLHPL